MSSRNAAPRLEGSLIARKGEATPIARAAQAVEEQIVQSESAKATSSKSQSGTIAVTLRLDPERYERLKLYGLKNRRTNQDILVEALDLFMNT